MSTIVNPSVTVLPPQEAGPLDEDLIAFYMAETKQSRRIVVAFLSFNLEPPHRDHTTRLGFSTFENKVLAATAPELDDDGLGDVGPLVVKR